MQSEQLDSCAGNSSQYKIKKVDDDAAKKVRSLLRRTTTKIAEKYNNEYSKI